MPDKGTALPVEAQEWWYDAAVEHAVRSVVTWQDIECHLNSAQAQISEIREIIRTFELK